MKMRNAAALILLAALAGAARAEDYEKSFRVTPGGTLHVRLAGGSIEVEGDDDARVELDARARGDATLEVRRDGNDIYVSTRRASGWRGWLGGGAFDLHAQVPRHYQLVLESSGGHVDVEDIVGNVSVKTSGGRIDLSEVAGDVELRTSGGGIEAREVAGNLRAETHGGSLRISEVRGGVDAETSGGEIRIGDAHGAVIARSTGGPIAVRFAGAPEGRLHSTGGPIEVEIPAGAGVRIEARALGGAIELDDELGEVVRGAGSDRADVTLNGGGPRLELNATGGGIRIRAR